MSAKLAKKLRLNATSAERLLWRALRNKQFAGLRFRRQQPIGPYVVDFYCSAARLIIELDGSHHADGKQPTHDRIRANWLEARGYRVLRFWNSDIMQESKAMTIIQRAVQDAGIPLPEPLRGSTLPQGEGGT